ncbi:MAG: PcfJ domain-containing protein [Treponemataceae bacterium]|nr:PcfJ domain-containing protein [Treponemataceae bacterium]
MGTLHYIRKFGSSDFEQTEMPAENYRMTVVRSDGILKKQTVFCPEHRRVETVHDNKTECGKNLDGILVEFPLFPAYIEDYFSRKRQFGRSYSYLLDCIIAGQRRLSLDSLLKSLSRRYMNELENEVKENSLDDNGVKKDIFAFSILTVPEKLYIRVDYYVLDREKMETDFYALKSEPIFKKYNILCKLDRNISLPSKTEEAPEFNVKFPQKAKDEIYQVLKTFTKRDLSFNTILDGEKLLEGIFYYPYEPNFLKLEDFSWDKSFADLKLPLLETRNPNIYNIVCEKLNIQSYPFLRKEFYKNPSVLLLYKQILSYGFKDVNIINEMLKEKKALMFYIIPDESNIRQSSTNKNFKFYLDFLLENKSERSAWNKLKNAENDIILEHDSLYTDYNDFLYMFKKTFPKMPLEIKKSILKDGYTEYNHDLLSKLSYDIENENIKFEYEQYELDLEDEIDGYRFMLPKDSDELRTIGSRLHNCVASYKDRVISKDCTIVFAMKDDDYRLCIEVDKDRVWQQRADRNRQPVGYDLEALNKWKAKHELSYYEN